MDRVIFNGKKTESFNRGQLLFLNEFRLYADDIKLIGVIEKEEDAIKKQKDIDSMQNWEKLGKCHLITTNARLCILVRKIGSKRIR